MPAMCALPAHTGSTKLYSIAQGQHRSRPATLRAWQQVSTPGQHVCSCAPLNLSSTWWGCWRTQALGRSREAGRACLRKAPHPATARVRTHTCACVSSSALLSHTISHSTPLISLRTRGWHAKRLEWCRRQASLLCAPRLSLCVSVSPFLSHPAPPVHAEHPGRQASAPLTKPLACACAPGILERVSSGQMACRREHATAGTRRESTARPSILKRGGGGGRKTIVKGESSVFPRLKNTHF